MGNHVRNGREARRRRQEEAAERQAEYDSLSTSDKLKRVRQRPGSSTREWDRLMARARKEKSK